MKSENIAILRAHLENMVSEALMAQKIGMDFTPSQIVDASIAEIIALISR
jgi:hypothetical protein